MTLLVRLYNAKINCNLTPNPGVSAVTGLTLTDRIREVQMPLEVLLYVKRRNLTVIGDDVAGE